jgi:hypothetical protein
VASDLVRIPRLTSRSGKLWGVATVVAVILAMGYVAVAQPEYAAAAAVMAVLAPLVAAALVSGGQWIEPATGRITTTRIRVLKRSVDLAEARTVTLVNNRGGGLHLTVKPRSGRAMLVPVLLLSDYVKRSQSPDLLRLLADQVEQRCLGAGKVPDQLRRQAEHLAKGGSAEDSPFASLVSHGVMTAAKGGGAAGGTSLLD